MSIAISTSFFTSLEQRFSSSSLFDIRALGFKEIELGFRHTTSQIKKVASERKRSGIRVRSVHNYCPIPPGLSCKVALPDYFSLSCLDHECRHKGIKYTKKSIDTAYELGAEAVVIHAGRVEIPDITKRLILLKTKKADRKKINLLKDSFLKERRKVARIFLDNLFKSLDILNRYAIKRNILLGIENRFYLREIPNFEELGEIFSRFWAGHIYYWHDTGHARIMEKLGLVSKDGYLKRYAKYMCGIHLHDLRGWRDHRLPLSGEIDFRRIWRYLKDSSHNIIKVMEVHPPATEDELRRAKDYLEKLDNNYKTFVK